MPFWMPFNNPTPLFRKLDCCSIKNLFCMHHSKLSSFLQQISVGAHGNSTLKEAAAIIINRGCLLLCCFHQRFGDSQVDDHRAEHILRHIQTLVIATEAAQFD